MTRGLKKFLTAKPHKFDSDSVNRFSSIWSFTDLSVTFNLVLSYSFLDYHCFLLCLLCRLVCSTVSAQWPATTPSVSSVSGRGSASCWHRATSFQSRSSSGVRQMTILWWDALMALSMSGRWIQVRTGWPEQNCCPHLFPVNKSTEHVKWSQTWNCSLTWICY